MLYLLLAILIVWLGLGACALAACILGGRTDERAVAVEAVRDMTLPRAG